MDRVQKNGAFLLWGLPLVMQVKPHLDMSEGQPDQFCLCFDLKVAAFLVISANYNLALVQVMPHKCPEKVWPLSWADRGEIRHTY